MNNNNKKSQIFLLELNSTDILFKFDVLSLKSIYL